MTNKTQTRETEEQRRTRIRGETLEAIANAQKIRVTNPQHEVVLVVDDKYAQNSVGLASEKRSVIPAYDFETACQAMEEVSPNVVLTDIEFPRSLEYRQDISPEEQAALERQRKSLFRGITDRIKEHFAGREERIHELDSYASKLYRPGEKIDFTKKRGIELAEELQTFGVNYGLAIVDKVQRKQIPYAVVTSTNHGNVAPGLVALGVCTEQEVVNELGKYKTLQAEMFENEAKWEENLRALTHLEAKLGKAIFVGHEGFDRVEIRGKDLLIWQKAYELATGQSTSYKPAESKADSPVPKSEGVFSRLRNYFAGR
jgi:hypothetical protein